jgi:glycosyltransferase involved in cell wall biosynthesis
MKILWVKTDFLHPTTRGGQIRTLQMLRCLHRKHEIHYVAFETPGEPEGFERSSEYCAKAYPVRHRIPPKPSLGFLLQVLGGVFSPLPVAVERYRSEAMRKKIEQLLGSERFDACVVDFIFPAINIGDPSRWIVFQHNLETTIWKRHAAHGNLLRRWFFTLQAERMARFEGNLCRKAKRVIAVSETDALDLQSMFQLGPVAWVPTGVDLAYFTRAPEAPKVDSDLVFVGSMDWMANQDGVAWFLDQVLPLIRRKHPQCTVSIVGRNPSSALLRRAGRDSRITVTGTVPDVRPYLWGARISIVPLRIGSGTRLKIFEAMAAKVPVVSTTIGAEGLPLTNGEHAWIADTAEDFARRCVELLEDGAERERLSDAAWKLVSERFSWESVTSGFESLLVC